MGEGSRDALVAEDVVKEYGATCALRGATLSVRAGEVHGLVGANGAGKSTLVKVLSGAVRPNGGVIGIGTWRGGHVTPRQAQALGLACIYQDASLVPTLGLVENVKLGRESGVGILRRRRDRAECEAVLRRVGLDPWSRALAGALKPADQQLLEIAKALHRDARVLIMDEPTAALGAEESRRLFEVIASLRADGVAVVYISHRLEDVLAVCDRITVMRDGRCAETMPAAGTTEAQLIRAMIGHDIRRVRVESAQRGEPLLEVRGLGQGTRVHDVSLTLHAGEVVGLTGLVGSGRSRLARMLFGCEPADRGEMLLDGRPYRPATPADAIGRGVALVPEDRKRDALLLSLSAAKNITLARMDAGPGGVLRLARERRSAGELMHRLQVKPRSPSALPLHMSGGNQQKVSIARWLHARSRVLILDEPGQGVDLGAKESILTTIRELAAEGRAILVISQEVEELQQVADRLLVMHRGRIAGELAGEDITEHRVVELAVGGSADARTPEGVHA